MAHMSQPAVRGVRAANLSNMMAPHSYVLSFEYTPKLPHNDMMLFVLVEACILLTLCRAIEPSVLEVVP